MKPFSLEQALTGEPVKLRDGSKAYVKYIMPEEYVGDYPLRGFYLTDDVDTGVDTLMWKMGNSNPEAPMLQYNIIGMWEEPRPRVQLDLPAPLEEPQEDMWFIHNDEVFKSDLTLSDLMKDPQRLEKGVYFATKADAQEWIDAMKKARK